MRIQGARGKVDRSEERDWSRLLSRGHDLADRIAAICSDKLAEDLVILDMEDVVGYTDCVRDLLGPEPAHVQAIAEEVELVLKHDEGLLPKGGEGRREGDWILLDYLDVVAPRVHARSADVLPDLEQLWGQVPAAPGRLTGTQLGALVGSASAGP